MPSDKPRLATYTDNNTITKFKYISNYNNRSMSNMLQTIVYEYIKKFEKEHGKIKEDN